MSKARFVGDPNDNFSGPDAFEWEGLEFSRTKWTEVPDGLALRLSKHNHYECEQASTPTPVANMASMDVTETAETFVSEKQNPRDPVRERLLAQANDLGLQIDGRWGLPRLQRTVDEACAAGN